MGSICFCVFLAGPATVQLVQTNPLASLTGASTQPLPVPDAPAGQRLEQLVDESGNLGHILVAPAPSRAHAPETHPAPLQMCGAPAPLPASSSAAGAAPQATTQTQTANQQPLFIPLLYAGQNPNAGEATSSSGPATAELHASASGARDERTATQLATSASAQTDEEELMCAASVKCDLHAGVHEEISIEKDIEWEKEKAKQTSVKAQPHAAGVGKGALDEASGARSDYSECRTALDARDSRATLIAPRIRRRARALLSIASRAFRLLSCAIVFPSNATQVGDCSTQFLLRLRTRTS